MKRVIYRIITAIIVYVIVGIKSYLCSCLEINTFPSTVGVQQLSHVRLCDFMDWSTPGFVVLHCLPEFVQSHVL